MNDLAIFEFLEVSNTIIFSSTNCFPNSNTLIFKVDLENDLDEVIHDEMCTYLDTDNPVDYLQDKKMINMIELIKKLTKEDCEKIYNSEQFYCIKDWNE